MTIEVLDPTYGEEPDPFASAARLDSLHGKTIGIVSNGKQGTGRFFDALEHELRDRFGVARVDRVTKPNYSAPAPPDVFDGGADWHALIAGIGD